MLAAQSGAPAAQLAEGKLRGELRFEVSSHREWFSSGAASDVYSIPHKARRWGRYQASVFYESKKDVEVSLGVPGKEGTVVKATLPAAAGRTRVAVGGLGLTQSGPIVLPLSLPVGAVAEGFVLHEVVLTPAPEGEPVKQAEDGSVLLLAKDATTFSENMRYEPNPAKNCLGFWTEKDDYAEWSFTVSKPGRFAVFVTQGNGAAGGSGVAVVSGGQRLDFVVKGTGGYQKWQEVAVGEMSFGKAGMQTLSIRPQTKVGPAVMDIQKIELRPL